MYLPFPNNAGLPNFYLCWRFANYPDASYPMMQGFLYSLYLQEVCQVPGGDGASWHLCICKLLPITRRCRAPSHLYYCRRFSSYWRWCRCSPEFVYLQTVANYPLMQGSLSLLYLQAVCQLPRGVGVPWHMQKDANYPMVEGSLSFLYFQAVCRLPGDIRLFVTSIFASGLPTNRRCRGSLSSLHLQAVCQFLDDAGLLSLLYCICRRFANYPVVPGSLPPIYALSWSLQSAFFTVALWISIIYWAVLHKYVVIFN